MDIKKANVNLLLGKIKTFLDAQPEATKNEEKFIEAEKALAKLQDLFSGKDGEIELLACRSDIRIIYP